MRGSPISLWHEHCLGGCIVCLGHELGVMGHPVDLWLQYVMGLVGHLVDLWLEHVVERCDVSLWCEHGLGGSVVCRKLKQDM